MYKQAHKDGRIDRGNKTRQDYRQSQQEKRRLPGNNKTTTIGNNKTTREQDNTRLPL
jgi:hypothetical protein